MNSRKLAVFVEGQTELVFVREFLKQWYGYNVSMMVDCDFQWQVGRFVA